ncbi:TadE/TadG family type IV pilus assembly protein [Stenotrophomonas rhizophila]
MRTFRSVARRQRGQSLLEFCIVVPAFIFLLLVIFQFVLIYRAKTLLDFAALQTARAGAVSGVNPGEMRSALEMAMAPLYASSPDAAGAIAARAKVELLWKNPLLSPKIEVISPTRAAFNEFRERQYDGRFALPNDNLAFRDARVGSSRVSVQDANILKIKVSYPMPLIVPFADRVIAGLSDLVSSGESYRPASMLMEDPLTGHRRMTIESYAIVRMQSPIHDSNNLAR